MRRGLDKDGNNIEIIRTVSEHFLQVVGKVVRDHPPRHEDVVEVLPPPLCDPVGAVLRLSDVEDSPREVHLM